MWESIISLIKIFVILWIIISITRWIICIEEKPNIKYLFKKLFFPITILILAILCLIFKRFRSWKYFKKEFFRQLKKLVFN